MRYLFISIFALGCAACSTSKPAAVAATPVRQPEAPIITRIVERHDVIVVRAGANGATYSVEGKGGQVIVPAMTLGDLAMKKPQVSQTVHAMQADVQWAGDE